MRYHPCWGLVQEPELLQRALPLRAQLMQLPRVLQLAWLQESMRQLREPKRAQLPGLKLRNR